MTKYIYLQKTHTFEKIPQYIYQRQNGWFEIRKRVGGILVYWGSFPTLEEAKLHKAYYIGKNWKVNPSFKNNRYISCIGDEYQIRKSINGKCNYFGTFDNLEDARHERDICVESDWDFDRIVEFDENEYRWLNRKIEG